MEKAGWGFSEVSYGGFESLREKNMRASRRVVKSEERRKTELKGKIFLERKIGLEGQLGGAKKMG